MRFNTVVKARQELERLYKIFGRVVLLVLPYGSKKLKGDGWQKITFEQTQAPAYQKGIIKALMRGGNLAVRLGPLSDGLRAIDIDQKGAIEGFRSLNPFLRNTATVYGLKGCQFLFRLRLGTSFPRKNAAVEQISLNGK